MLLRGALVSSARRREPGQWRSHSHKHTHTLLSFGALVLIVCAPMGGDKVLGVNGGMCDVSGSRALESRYTFPAHYRVLSPVNSVPPPPPPPPPPSSSSRCNNEEGCISSVFLRERDDVNLQLF